VVLCVESVYALSYFFFQSNLDGEYASLVQLRAGGILWTCDMKSKERSQQLQKPKSEGSPKQPYLFPRRLLHVQKAEYMSYSIEL